ncbi:CAP domain-containing protein [Cellulomonas sp. 179-A 9B4 NHS]|uniref:CAP domain-containing protein n=1 Tax=Cellulomonas sp. 179-A 9B4 NHS TaxID=3142379 RepID=UPI0039A24D49
MPELPVVRRREIRRWQQRRRRRGPWSRLLAPVGALALASGAVVALAPGAQAPVALTAAVEVDDRRDDAASRTAERAATPTASPTASATAAPTPTAAPPEPTVTPEAAAAPEPAPEAPAAPAPEPAPEPRRQQAAAAPEAAPAAAPASAPADAMAARIVELTNAERRAAGLGDLAVSACAAQQALARTAVLVAEGRFEHDPLQPILAACPSRTVGENLSLGYPTAEAAVTGWMNSSGHRANILRTSYGQIGVGCTSGPRGWLCAQVFLG